MTLTLNLLTAFIAAIPMPPVSFVELWAPPAVTGREQGLMDVVARKLPPGLAKRRDAYGSLIVSAEGAVVTRVLAVAVDDGGFVVSGIRPDGYLRLRSVTGRGGSAAARLEGRPVRVHGTKGQVPAVVLAKSVHLGGARPDRVTEEHLFVDVGADSVEDVAGMGIALLDPVTSRELVVLGGALAGPGVARRCILAATLSALRSVPKEAFPRDLAVVFVAQSRLGGRPLGLGWRGVIHGLLPERAHVVQPGGNSEQAVTTAGGSTGVPELERLSLRTRYLGTPVEMVRAADVEALADHIASGLMGVTAGASEIQWPASMVHTMPNDAAAITHEDAVTYLAGLTAVSGVSGHEEGVRNTLRFFLNRMLQGSARPEVDEAGNMTLTVGQGARSLLFIAHMDEVGFVVQRIGDDGRCLLRPRGGLYVSLYGWSAMELVMPTGVIPGVSVVVGEELWLDLGTDSREKTEALGVTPGQPATVPKEFLRLGAHRASGRSPDDRVGCAALVMAIKDLDLEALDRKVIFAWVTREETGLHGAEALARRLATVPEAVFPVDTFVTSDNPREDHPFVYARLGAGPVLRAMDSSAITLPTVLGRVRGIAEGRGIPLGVGIMGGGNDGSRFVPRGAVNCPLSWPQRCSHTRVETMDLRDLERLAELVRSVAVEY